MLQIIREEVPCLLYFDVEQIFPKMLSVDDKKDWFRNVHTRSISSPTKIKAKCTKTRFTHTRSIIHSRSLHVCVNALERIRRLPKKLAMQLFMTTAVAKSTRVENIRW